MCDLDSMTTLHLSATSLRMKERAQEGGCQDTTNSLNAGMPATSGTTISLTDQAQNHIAREEHVVVQRPSTTQAAKHAAPTPTIIVQAPWLVMMSALRSQVV